MEIMSKPLAITTASSLSITTATSTTSTTSATSTTSTSLRAAPTSSSGAPLRICLDSIHISPKTEEERKFLNKAVVNHYLFASFDENQQKATIDTFKKKSFDSGEVIIKEGDIPNELFLIGSGICECFKEKKKKCCPNF